MSSNCEHYISYLNFLFSEVPSLKIKISLAILDKLGHFDHNGLAGDGTVENNPNGIGTGYLTHTAAEDANTFNFGAKKDISLLHQHNQ